MNLLFQPRFADKVASGEKTQTIRPPRKDGKPNVKVGQLLSLRKWEGKPYWSKQVKLREDAPCKAISPVAISSGGIITLDGKDLPKLVAKVFAQRDGFDDVEDLLKYFAANGGLPFTGVLIQW